MRDIYMSTPIHENIVIGCIGVTAYEYLECKLNCYVKYVMI